MQTSSNSFFAGLGVPVTFEKGRPTGQTLAEIFIAAVEAQKVLASEKLASKPTEFNTKTKGKSLEWFSVIEGQIRTRVRSGSVNLTADYALVESLAHLLTFYDALIAKAKANDAELVAMLEANQVKRKPKGVKVPKGGVEITITE